MSIDPRALRDALGRFVTGVTVIATRAPDGELSGITANSFNWVSEAPPLVLFSIARSSQSFEAFLRSTHFTVNVLGEDQAGLAARFAASGGEKWKGLDYEIWDSGCPVLPEAMAAFECLVHARHDGGDHVVYVGEVRRLRYSEDAMPLLFYHGGYAELAPHAAQPPNAAGERRHPCKP